MYWNTTHPLFNDTQAQIRNFIKDAYVNWETDYILLGGDADDYRYNGECIIPFRALTYSFDYGQVKIPSDLYYGCLDGNYNSDQDSFWGEFNDGANGTYVDLFAEVYVGRASVDSIEEVSNFVWKTIMYEYSSDPYLEQVLMVGENLPGDGGAIKDETINGSNAGGFTTVGIPGDVYNISTLYDRDWQPSGWPTSELINRINNGINIINHIGHSGPGWNMRLTPSDVENFINDHYCFIYSIGCDPGAFDHDDCIAEAFTTTPHGAFATVHATCTIGGTNYYDREFYDAIYGENITELGRANQDSKEDRLIAGWIDRIQFYAMTLFGDPEVSMKQPLSPDHDVSMTNLTAPLYVMPNETFLVNATIINFGGDNETDVLVNLTVNGIVQENDTISILPSGNETTLSFNCSLPLGVHKVGIMIQPVSNETITLNNVLNRTVICGPDVAITSISTPTSLYINNTVEIGATVSNKGKNNLSDLNLTLKIDNIIVDNITISMLLSGQAIYQTFEWMPTTSKLCVLSVYVAPVSNENYTLISNNHVNTTIHPVDHIVYVDDDGGKDFTTITEAIRWIGTGDSIFVYNGTYHENVYIYKTIKLIGEDKNTTIIDGMGYKTIHIQIYDVNISGFTIQNGIEGIHIDGRWYGYRETITGNIISNNQYGMLLESSWYNIITDNIISNSFVSLDLRRSWFTTDYNIITGNNISNVKFGIVAGGSNNIITGNTIISYSSAYSAGIMAGGSNNIITGNNISNATYGIMTGGSSNNINNIITGNNISNNNNGITIQTQLYCNNTIITGNNILSSNVYGIYIVFSGNETIYHNNFVDNTHNAYDDSVTTNIWDNGYPSGGNYWDDYTGEDNNGDHIGDTPYNISGGSSKDNYPLMGTYGQPNAEFTYTQQGMNVTFNASSSYDYDGTIVSYDWDFGDGSNGSGSLLSHTYVTAGSYLVVLTVTDNEGKQDTTSKIILNSPPVFGSPNPTNGSTGNPLSFTWSIPITDPEGNTFSWTIQCSNGQSSSATGATNGTKTLALTSLSYVTTYKVWVNATDPTGSGLYTRRWYTFTTKVSQPPVFGSPTPTNGSTGNPVSLTWSIPITDPEGNTFSWTIQ